MLLYTNYNIVFQEVPGEVSLAINLSNCPNRCPGCHSPYLQENTGTPLTETVLQSWLDRYGDAITCVCFMGGDAAPDEVERLASFIRQNAYPKSNQKKLKTCWYSGKNSLPENFNIQSLNYIKLGSYIQDKGGLSSPGSNQKFYRIDTAELTDLTYLFWRSKL